MAASPPEQEVLGKVAAQFTEEDLTRYLRLSLDLFRDLQSSLQPRLHLELGLLRLVHAGKLQSIEEAIAGIGSAPAPTVKAAPTAPPAPEPDDEESLREAKARFLRLPDARVRGLGR